jgi:dihydroxy-acid dehydratase
MGVELDIEDFQAYGHDIPLLVNCQPAGTHLAESYHRAGGVPAVMGELIRAGRINTEAMTVTAKTVGELYGDVVTNDPDVIRSYEDPLMSRAGFVVLSGNLFDSAIMKTSVISPTFRERYLSSPGEEGAFVARAIVFEGPEDYHERINDPGLNIDESCILVIRGSGPVAYPGSAEVVNMQPPDALIKSGTTELPTLGDGRQSGTSGSPSILNASPESAMGSGLAILQTGDRIRVDIPERRVDVLLTDAEIAARWEAHVPAELEHQTPWQEIYRGTVGQLGSGACLELATGYHRAVELLPRHSH